MAPQSRADVFRAMSRSGDQGFGPPTAILATVMRTSEPPVSSLPCLFCIYDFDASDESAFRIAKLTTLGAVEAETGSSVPKKSLGRNDGGPALLKYSRAWVHLRVAAAGRETQQYVASLPSLRRQRIDFDIALIELSTYKHAAADILACLGQHFADSSHPLAQLVEILQRLAQHPELVRVLDEAERHRFLAAQFKEIPLTTRANRPHFWKEASESMMLATLALALECEIPVQMLDEVLWFRTLLAREGLMAAINLALQERVGGSSLSRRRLV